MNESAKDYNQQQQNLDQQPLSHHYGTFQGVNTYPPPSAPPVIGFPQPVPPPGTSGGPSVNDYVHGYQAVTGNTRIVKSNFKTRMQSIDLTATGMGSFGVSLKNPEQKTGEKMVRYGIIGAGMMGREHLLNLYHLQGEGAAVVCVADPHVPSQKVSLEFAESFGWPLKVFSGHKEMLDSGLCDVVVISTPNMTHYEILMDIINHPKTHHVLVEKPLCTTVEDCRQVIEAAKKRPDMLVQVGLEYRYMPPVAKLIDIVKGGKLGHVKMVSIREHRFPFLVKVDNWNRFNCNSGGTLVEKCCHFFDLMRLFAGSNPVRVMASGAIDINHKDEIYDGKVPDIIDNAYVIVEFENGARGMLDLCMFAEGSKNEQEIAVIGEIGKGEIFVPENIVRYGLRVEGRDGVRTMRAEDHRIKYDGLHHGSSYLEHLNFLSAVKAEGKKIPAVDLHDGLIAVAIGVAAQLSIEMGRFVSIKEVIS